MRERAGGTEWADPRLARQPDERKIHRYDDAKKASAFSTRPRVTTLVLIFFAASYLLGIPELLLALGTSVRCGDATGLAAAGANVTCVVATAALASESDLSITQVGTAGTIALVNEAARTHDYLPHEACG